MLQKNSVNTTGWALLLLIMFFHHSSHAQVQGTEKRYIRVGELQSMFSAYGSERAWNNIYYEGLMWPASYTKQDNAVIKRSWIACSDFTDASGIKWEKYGINFTLDYEKVSLFPMQLQQTARFSPPLVYVNGSDITAPFSGEVDQVDADLIADREVINVVNTTMGLTMTRRILAFSQQYHNNYFIIEYTFTNTGNTDYDDAIELNAELKGVRISWGTRYSVCREGSEKIGDGQSWGKHSWVTKRGENYASHSGELVQGDEPIPDWLRCGFSWAGQSSVNTFDNIGGPYVAGDGRLTAPQHAGSAILHVDKSSSDHSDDPNQPAVLGWHAGDTYPSLGTMSASSTTAMLQLYDMLSGNPYTGLGGVDRMDEVYMSKNPDPYTVHNDGGGTNVWIAYGPFDIPHGQSITIVEAEAVAGINRLLCEQIGRRWKQAYTNSSDRGPFTLPDGTTTTDKDVYKDKWTATGKDSIMLTFSRAKRNYDSGYKVPQPPLPPSIFNVESGGGRISLKWSPSPSEEEPGFAGYKIFRAIGKPDTVYAELCSVDRGVTSYDDVTAVRKVAYYYYIVSVNDGSNNTSGRLNPAGPLTSSRFYTQTTEPAELLKEPATTLENIRVVPNPYNIRSRDIQYPGEDDKITFLNLPPFCTIRIFTERGDLIETIDHNNGSGDEAWNSITSSRQVVVSGIYIAHFEVTRDYADPNSNERLFRKGDSTYRKFVIIR